MNTSIGRGNRGSCGVGRSRSEFPPGYGYLLGTNESQCSRPLENDLSALTKEVNTLIAPGASEQEGIDPS
jgi:hypothetical protein